MPDLMDQIEAIFTDSMRRRAQEEEIRLMVFMGRTGLPVSQITKVYFKDKMFPQWIGAVQPWKWRNDYFTPYSQVSRVSAPSR